MNESWGIRGRGARLAKKQSPRAPPAYHLQGLTLFPLPPSCLCASHSKRSLVCGMGRWGLRSQDTGLQRLYRRKRSAGPGPALHTSQPRQSTSPPPQHDFELAFGWKHRRSSLSLFISMTLRSISFPNKAPAAGKEHAG